MTVYVSELQICIIIITAAIGKGTKIGQLSIRYTEDEGVLKEEGKGRQNESSAM